MRSIILVAAFLVSSGAVRGSAGEPHSVNELAWLAGCWASVGAEEGSGEQWTQPAGGTMFGVSRSVRDSQTVAHEFMQIRETEDQSIEFLANPSGQEGATFVMVSLKDGEVVFENPDHDFPQRIIYQLMSDGTLAARIEGEIDGELQTVEFPMRRTSCTPSRSGP